MKSLILSSICLLSLTFNRLAAQVKAVEETLSIPTYETKPPETSPFFYLPENYQKQVLKNPDPW